LLSKVLTKFKSQFNLDTNTMDNYSDITGWMDGMFGENYSDNTDWRDGKFGDVCTAKCILNIPSYDVTIKRIRGEYINDQAAVNEDMEILREINHPIIVSYTDHFFDDNKMVIVMENIDQETMFVYRSSKLIPSYEVREQSTLSLLCQLSCALSHLHQRGIMHRDLNPYNIHLFYKELRSRHNSDDLIYEYKFKLADVGLLKLMKSEVQRNRYTNNGNSSNYIAPEVLSGEAYTYSADMWSVGAILYYWYHRKHFSEDPGGLHGWSFTRLGSKISDLLSEVSSRRHSAETIENWDWIIQGAL